MNKFGKLTLKTKYNIQGIVFIIPFFCGTVLFYFIPFLLSVFYSFTSGMNNSQFVGLQNYIQLFHNKSFLLALKNTILFLGIAIPLLLSISLGIALFLQQTGTLWEIIRGILLVPMIVPIASTVMVWKVLFDDYGILNHVFQELFGQAVLFLESGWAFVIVILIFIWKNCGYLALIYVAALSNMPREYLEAARIEGGHGWKILKNVTIPYLRPTTFFAFLVSMIEAFKIFREVYMLTGKYPDTSIYFIQHFMNNNLMNLNYQRLSSACVFLSILIFLIAAIIFWREKSSAKQ